MEGRRSKGILDLGFTQQKDTKAKVKVFQIALFFKSTSSSAQCVNHDYLPQLPERELRSACKGSQVATAGLDKMKTPGSKQPSAKSTVVSTSKAKAVKLAVKRKAKDSLRTIDGGIVKVGDSAYCVLKLEEFNELRTKQGLDDLQPCEVCDKIIKKPKSALLECNKCLRGYHLSCLSPPLQSVPEVSTFEHLLPFLCQIIPSPWVLFNAPGSLNALNLLPSICLHLLKRARSCQSARPSSLKSAALSILCN